MNVWTLFIVLALTVVLWVVSGCTPSRSQVSSRPPGLFDKNVGSITGGGRPIDIEMQKPEMFIRRKTTKVVPVDRANETGSLFNPDDERNFLFASGGPVAVGRYLTVHVHSNRVEKAPKDEKAANGDKAAGKAEGEEALEQELLSALPELEPADKESASLIKRFQMKVVHRYENGDVLALMTRRSTRGPLGNEITVQARVPYSRLVSGDDLTTDDLSEVHLVESADGEVVDRRSSGWEDEYTLRLSGFDEAKSRIAMELEDKRNRLLEVRESLRNKIESLGKERRKIADERERMTAKNARHEEEKNSLTEKVKEQEEKIKEQAEQIEELQPEDKPGDEKDGADGD